MFALGPLSFLTPLLLLALISLPLIWWLLRTTPPAPDRVRFPAFMILRRLTNVKETPDKTPWWLILLRLLLAAFVIIGLAGPILNAPDIEANDGPLVIVLDNTYGAAPRWRQRRTIIEQAAEQARQTGRAVYFMTTAPSLSPAKDQVRGPLDARALRALAGQITPTPLSADRENAASLLEIVDQKSGIANGAGTPTFWWLSDALGTNNKSGDNAPSIDQAFAQALRDRGELVVYSDPGTPLLGLTPVPNITGEENRSDLQYAVQRRNRAGALDGVLVATARDGRELDRQRFQLDAGERERVLTISLPLALQNDLAMARIEGARSAASVWLSDARDRRALIGLMATEREASAALLSGNHYVRQAMAPFAAFQDGDILTLTQAEVSVIILDDLGRLRSDEETALRDWLNKGGVLIRFAGPRLADAALDSTPALLPVRLRRGERALGGTLTWGTPQPLGSFSDGGPFAGLAPPDDVVVRQQVLAEPGGETSARTWASLADGTPLVTGYREGNGVIVLFHTTATPLWSDLPISEAFIEMLKKLTFLSALSPDRLDDNLTDQEKARFAPLRILDGYGQFTSPSSATSPISLASGPKSQAGQTIARLRATPQSPPGLYGSPEAPLAVNVLAPNEQLTPLSVTGGVTKAYVNTPPKSLGPPLFMLALIALLIDLVATLFLKGVLTGNRKANVVSTQTGSMNLIIVSLISLLSILALTFIAPIASAQTPDTKPLDLPIDPRTAQAALTTRFAYVDTGNSDTNRLAELGLTALSQELSRRTTVSPALPVSVDLANDDFSIYPVLYWAIEPGMETITNATLANVENFMQLGGLIIFDTRDDERAIDGVETPEAATLRKILTRIDTPPLTQLPRDHVLTRSYYLLPGLRGRTSNRPVWVAAGSAINDGVTPLIIGGRDWIGAWARSPDGRPLRSVAADQGISGNRARELAYRAGINMMMVAFTGNYKTDQVHTDILLRRLGE